MSKLSAQTQRHIALGLCVVLVAQLAACGTLIYPERRGQTSGKIDPGVAILDGVGLLLFVIPGLIAFGIDFSTGAIYLPPGQANLDAPDGEDSDEPWKVVRLGEGERDAERIQETVAKATGLPVRLDDPDLIVYRYPDRAALLNELARRSESIEASTTVARRHR